MKLTRQSAMVLVAALLAAACDEPRPTPAAPNAARAARTREPIFVSRASKVHYDRGVAALGAMNSLRGATMTDALATKLGFECADLKAVAAKLASERDPAVWRLRTDIDKTCNFDVPVATARLAVQNIEHLRATDSGASVERDCASLKLAIGDTGSGYLQNPVVLQLGDKFLTYCERQYGDTVRRIP
jgi:hypothetical protein